MLNKLKVKLTSKILYEKIRHPVTNKITSILNGTRFMYIEPLPAGESLPKFNWCAGLRCKILHFGQPKNSHILRCTKCWKTGLTKSSICKNYSCMSNVHTMKSRSISLHSADHKTFCLIFTRASCISTASNINPPNMRFNIPKRFAGCGDLDVASKITAAEDALSAMRLEKKIKTNEQWNATKETVMEKIIENKSVQVKLFQEKIRSAKQFT